MTDTDDRLDRVMAGIARPGPVDDDPREYSRDTFTSADDREYEEDDARAADRYEREMDDRW